ncbi:hypothetical protein SAMN05660350_04824 [Geodermatophilus obscurus]|uniref:ATP/GTP-binding protein n=1 Tax=Geodermatophilus obscurus TaxID=1861 RepID=A0A1M7V0U7_9ACTN|nr:hypothetical protein [Geodermatophilus obscurus]SHN88834.1 hypothetical protein SAMN05660350_04824 [Geodermatophilus obscurus]
MRQLTERATCLLALLAGLIALPSPASADPTSCTVYDRSTGECVIQVQVPGNPSSGGGSNNSGGDDSGGNRGGGGGDPATPACIDDASSTAPTEVPCSSSAGYWSNEHDCYVAPMNPQPPAGSPLFSGNTGGAVYTCSYPYTLPGTGVTFFWAADPPAGPAAPPDPAVLAQQALAAMQLRAIDIGMVPEPDPSSVGLVGLPTWLWVNTPNEQTFGPVSRTVAAGGVSVTATARVERVVWSMGDGQNVTCTGAGTPYVDSYGRSDSPDCGHTYTRTSAAQPDGAYTVTATSYWTVDWAGGGQTGTIDDVSFTQEAQVRIGELQVIQTD